MFSTDSDSESEFRRPCSVRIEGESMLPASTFPDSVTESDANITAEMPPLPMLLPPRVADVAAMLAFKQRAAPSEAGERIPSIPGYTILAVLGHGGMGVVYKARHLPLERIVAVKMLRAGAHACAEELTRFRCETEAVAAMRHPGIVQIYETGMHEGQPYCALEYLEGGSLAKRLANGPLAPVVSSALVEAVARAVQFAHEHGIVHRDLKPANILLEEPDLERTMVVGRCKSSPAPGFPSLQPKVCDFGLAKRLDVDVGQTRTGQILGTPAYMAPESLDGQISPSVDIYALGAILYESLTGRPPFQGATVEETLRLTTSEDPLPPSRLQPGLPRDLNTIVLKCLCRAPNQRYATAGALADDLLRFRLGEPIHARPAGIWERSQKWVRRRPAMTALLAISALSLAALLGGSLWFNAKLRVVAGGLSQALDQVTIERDESNRSRIAADAARDQANRSLAQAMVVSERLAEVSNFFLRGVPGTGRIRRELLEELERARAECNQSSNGGQAVEQIRGRLMWRIGLIYHDLGESAAAEQILQSSLTLFERLHRELPNDPGITNDLAYCYHNLAVVLQSQAQGPTQSPVAEEYLRAAVQLRQDLIRRQPNQPDHVCDLAKHLNNLGEILAVRGQFVEADQAHTRAISELTPVAQAHLDRIVYRQVLGMNYHNLGRLCETMARRDSTAVSATLERAETRYGQAIAERRLVAAHPRSPREARGELAASLSRLAVVQGARKRTTEQIQSLREVVELRQKQVDDYSTIGEYQRDLGSALNNFAIVLRNGGQAKEAIELLRRAIRHQELAIRLDSGDSLARKFLRNHYGSLALALATVGDHAAAALAADELARFDPKSSTDAFTAARCLARCAELSTLDPALDPNQRKALQSSYADRAMQYLTQAQTNGLTNEPRSIRGQNGRPLDHPDFKPLHDHPGFKELRSSLGPQPNR